MAKTYTPIAPPDVEVRVETVTLTHTVIPAVLPAVVIGPCYEIVEVLNSRTVITMVVREGKIRQVRRMLNTLRHKVVFVRRTRIGAIRLGDLPIGGVRHLTAGEIRSIFESEKSIPNPAPGKGKE